MDGEGIDAFVGTNKHSMRANAIACSVDILKRDFEITIIDRVYLRGNS